MFTITNIDVASLALGAVQALPQHIHARQDNATSTPAAPAAPASTPDIFDDLLTAPTAIKRFQRLLTVGEGPEGPELLKGDDLRKATVFTFDRNMAPPPGAEGGVAVAAVSLSFP